MVGLDKADGGLRCSGDVSAARSGDCEAHHWGEFGLLSGRMVEEKG